MLSFEEAFNPKPVEVPLNGKKFYIRPTPALEIHLVEEVWDKMWERYESKDGEQRTKVNKEMLITLLSMLFQTDVTEEDAKALTTAQLFALYKEFQKINGIAGADFTGQTPKG